MIRMVTARCWRDVVGILWYFREGNRSASHMRGIWWKGRKSWTRRWYFYGRPIWRDNLPRRFWDLGLGNVDIFGEWRCISAVTIDVARLGVDKKHLVEKVQLRAKECEDHSKASLLWEAWVFNIWKGELVSLSHAIVSNFGRGGK